MKQNGVPTLLRGLALAAEALGPSAEGVKTGDDPLRLDLPSLTSAGDLPSAATVRIFASLYLTAELEQAGVVPIAELFVQERDSLDLRSYDAAAKLDDFATREHEWYDRAGRTQLYARLFGMGPAATNESGTLVNREFTSLFASLCRALSRSIVDEAGVRITATMVLSNLAPRGLVNTLLAARRIEDQTRRAVDILRDQAIDTLVGARTLQQAILNVLGKDAPDVQRLIDSGLNGQAILEWLATKLPLLGDQSAAVMTAGDRVAVNAALWLRAVGVDTPQPQQVAA